MAVNKPVGDNARKGAVKKRSQLATKIQGKSTWTKRSKESGQFMDQKKAPSKKPFKGVEREETLKAGRSSPRALAPTMPARPEAVPARSTRVRRNDHIRRGRPRRVARHLRPALKR